MKRSLVSRAIFSAGQSRQHLLYHSTVTSLSNPNSQADHQPLFFLNSFANMRTIRTSHLDATRVCLFLYEVGMMACM